MTAQNCLKRDRYDAVLFDMDGVITDTASAHAEAWKRLFDAFLEERAKRDGGEHAPFDAHAEYREYVDGKPRFDGVRSFLESRGIDLPYGDPDDDADQETVCGLGNRKDGYFNDWLRDNLVRVFPGTLEFIRALRAAGVRVAVFTASRNADAVLSNAGVADLFDAKVDGRTMARLNLPGKPDPAMLELAATEVGVPAERCVIVEDAIAGVQAGSRGSFALVIGIDRADYAKALRENGADLVVNDLSECRVDDAGSFTLKSTKGLASVREFETALEPLLRRRRIAVLLDYDGTLTPIVSDYRKALLGESMRETLAALAERHKVAVISGRDLEDVRRLVALDSVFYSGSHGFELAGPGDWRHVQEQAVGYLDDLDQAEQALAAALAAIPGHAIERKRFSIAVHYRQVDDTHVEEVASAVDTVLADNRRLYKGLGKKVFELKPALQWDKGRAVELLLKKLGMNDRNSIAFYIGDDITDEAAYRVLRKPNVSIVIPDDDRVTSADYALEDCDDVQRFLDWLATIERRAALPRLARDDRGRIIDRSAWSLVYDGYDPAAERLRETLCTLGNGYFATRGASPDSVAGDNHYPGTYFAGVYNRLTSEIAGESIENEDLVNWPNWLELRIRPEGEDWLSIDGVELLAYRQELSLRDGVLHRDIRFRHGDNRITRWTERRLVGMHDPHIAGLKVAITPENWSGALTICSALDGSVRNRGVARYRQLADHHTRCVSLGEIADDTIQLVARATQSRIEVAEAARTRVYRDGNHVVPVVRTQQREDWIGQELDVEVHAGAELGVEKIVAFCTSRDRGVSEAGYEAARTVATTGNFDRVLALHARGWHALWEEFDFALDKPGDDDTALKLRVHIFHLLQTISPHTLATDAGVPARGWHGEAYRGHVFWDEIFILPLLNLRMPLLTKAMLRYRYRRLREARQAARAAGFRGAMFPWQSGSDGREESQRIHLNPKSGHWTPDITYLQRHISAAVAYCVWQYYEVTANQEFLTMYGAEMFLEIARFWASVTEYNESIDRYEIKGVVGPDEFHTAYPDRADSQPGLDNNAYTNVMAAWVLTRAADLLERLSPHRRHDILRRLRITDEELELWDAISRKMRIVFHEDGIISQFEGYDDLEELDWDAYREKYGDIQRLDRILESEGDSPNRYKLSKQADVLMLFYLFSAEELGELFGRLGYAFEPDMIPRNVEYYAQRTSDGSTLSHIVRSWVEARTDREGSWRRFLEALSVDIGDIQGGTTTEGIHLGAMAGTVDMLHRCYTGFETRNEKLYFAPDLPVDVRELSVAIRYRQQRIVVTIDQSRLVLDSLPGRARSITVCYRGEERELEPGERIEYELSQT